LCFVFCFVCLTGYCFLGWWHYYTVDQPTKLKLTLHDTTDWPTKLTCIDIILSCVWLIEREDWNILSRVPLFKMESYMYWRFKYWRRITVVPPWNRKLWRRLVPFGSVPSHEKGGYSYVYTAQLINTYYGRKKRTWWFQSCSYRI